MEQRWVGRPIPRVEDDALLRGRGRFLDDLIPVPSAAHAALVRSPWAHARVESIDTSRAEAAPGVVGVVTGEALASVTRPMHSVLPSPVPQRALGVDSVRYVGEPVAVVAARDRYLAEDAADLIDVEYSPMQVVTDPLAAAGAAAAGAAAAGAAAAGAAAAGAAAAGDAVAGAASAAAAAGDAVAVAAVAASTVAAGAVAAAESAAAENYLVSDRTFSYGQPEEALAEADLLLCRRFRFPRWSGAPVECYCVVADWDAGDDSLTVWANFQGPFTLHTVAAAALGLPAAKLRIITPPDSGGSFGVKAAVFSYVVLLGAASRILGIPLRWTEDRHEHLAASSMATERITDLSAGFAADGELLALSYDVIEDVGAYLQAPEPASLYRMHGTLTGAYRVENLAVRNRVVLTNRCPTGLNRGFGGPQMYLPLERTMATAAARLGIDPVSLAHRNLLKPSEFPYRTASGGMYDSGDYPACLHDAAASVDYAARRRVQADARAEGRLIGVGLACVVEPSVSNMGYVSLAETPAERRAGLPKSGNVEAASVAMNPMGGVTVSVGTTPQGQGHRTVASAVAADRLGLDPSQIDVRSELDTHRDAWTISSGNYSSRFSGVGVAAVDKATRQLAEKLRQLAAENLECAAEDVELRGGRAVVVGQPDSGIPLRQLAGQAHWNPASLPEGMEPGLAVTAFASAPGLEAPNDADEVVASAAHGFVVDIAVVEVDRETAEVRVIDYVSVHDAGTLLHPRLADGQILGSFVHGLGPALGERMVYDHEGNLLTGTFMDYQCVAAAEVPPIRILHRQTPSPNTPLGAKGLGEGNTMSAPAALANAVCDALEVEDVELPLTPSRLWELVRARGLS